MSSIALAEEDRQAVREERRIDKTETGEADLCRRSETEAQGCPPEHHESETHHHELAFPGFRIMPQIVHDFRGVIAFHLRHIVVGYLALFGVPPFYRRRNRKVFMPFGGIRLFHLPLFYDPRDGLGRRIERHAVKRIEADEFVRVSADPLDAGIGYEPGHVPKRFFVPLGVGGIGIVAPHRAKQQQREQKTQVFFHGASPSLITIYHVRGEKTISPFMDRVIRAHFVPICANLQFIRVAEQIVIYRSENGGDHVIGVIEIQFAA